VYEGVVMSNGDEVGITVDAQGKVIDRHSEKGERRRGDRE
jgi:hypothetical protein